MKVNLAGYNVDADELEKVKSYLDDSYESLTPETLSAAYARISRDPATVDKLRKKALGDVEKAKASNEQIVFGFGHASIAEHAVLNFDIIGLSRLAIETLEHSRLCSYTEKSQRYQKLKDDYIIPKELEKNKEEFRSLVKFQNDAYRKAYKALVSHFKNTIPDGEYSQLLGRAKEDARYLTSLAMEGQLGMTLNARNLEAMIRRLSEHPLAEVKELSKKLHEKGMKIVPSLLRHTDDPSRSKTIRDISKIPYCLFAELLLDQYDLEYPEAKNVRMISTNGTEEIVATALLLENCDNTFVEFETMLQDQGIVLEVFKAVFSNMDRYCPVPRAFELCSNSFELTMSASCFAQMKRHRMATVLPQSYDIDIPPRMPPSFAKAGLDDLFEEVMNKSSEFFLKMKKENPEAAYYALTQAHRRRVIVLMNARELYAFARLRMDIHAQWEIRVLAEEMVRQARKRSPLLMALACGKDRFDELKPNIMEAISSSQPYSAIRKIWQC